MRISHVNKIIVVFLVFIIFTSNGTIAFAKSSSNTNPGILMMFCANNPISSKYNVEGMTAGQLINGCKEKLDGYSWGSRIYILIYAPGWNEDPHSLEIIGNTVENPISAWSSEGEMTLAGPGCNGFIETGPDHGLFFGSIKLSGFRHDINGDGRPDAFGGNRCESGVSIIDDGSGRVEAKQDGSVTVSWEYYEDEFLMKSAHYTWREATLEFDQQEYLLSEEVKLTLTDLDNVRWPFDDDIAFPVHIYSDSDQSGIMMDAYWVPNYKGIVQMNGYFPLQFNLAKNGTSEESSNPFGHGTGELRASVGDTIYAKYDDFTLPKPYSTQDSKTIIAVAKVVGYKDGSTDSKVILGYTPFQKDASSEQENHRITPTDTALSKYTMDGTTKITMWWDYEREFVLNKNHKLHLLFEEAKTEYPIKDIKYDFEIILNGDIIQKEENGNSLDGHATEIFSPKELGNATVHIYNINDFKIEQKFTIPIVEKSIQNVSFIHENMNEIVDPMVFVTHLEQNHNVPTWIESVSELWWKDQISDSEMIEAMKYLTVKKII